MSARIKTVLPLVSQELVIAALEKMGEKYQVEGHIIHLLSRSNAYYNARLTRIGGGRYVLVGDSDEISSGFQSRLTQAYKEINELRKKKEKEKLVKAELRKAEQEELMQKQATQERICGEQEKLRRRTEVQQVATPIEEQPSVPVEDSKLVKIEQEEEIQQKIEQEKREYVESQKKMLYEKAKKMGYKVKEKHVEGKVKLELVKRIY